MVPVQAGPSKGGTGSGDVNERERVSVFQGMKNAGFQVTTEAWIESYDQIYEKCTSGVEEKYPFKNRRRCRYHGFLYGIQHHSL